VTQILQTKRTRAPTTPEVISMCPQFANQNKQQQDIYIYIYIHSYSAYQSIEPCGLFSSI
jgi:hypothetical protein